jgi:GTP-binding protein HflX
MSKGEALPPPAPIERDEHGLQSTAPVAEKAVLAALLPRKDPRNDLPDPLGELAMLAETAGVDVIAERVVQRKDRPDPATAIYKGTVSRLGEVVEREQANVVIFDHELKPRQRRNLEKILNKKVIDRTELILDIFAQHARTPQAKLQVEVAQLEYELPRLRRMWTHLDTGVGLRAAGEKQIEVDRRLVRKRIQDLRKELANVRARRERQASRQHVYTVALVGYTNAGKSTLMNRLTEADVYVADKLFATLDTRTRAWEVGPKRTALLSDTVGFIRNLPHHLVESFHATLEEVLQADLLLHVVDASDPESLDQVRAVREVLEELGVKDRPEIVVLNKVDQAKPELLPYLERRLVNTIRVSALTGEGADALKAKVNAIALGDEGHYELSIDVREGAAIAAIEAKAEILSKDIEGERMLYEVRCRRSELGAIQARVRQPDGLQVEELTAAPGQSIAPPPKEEWEE